MNNSMKKHIPERMCVACRKMFPKTSLIRIVRDNNGEIVFDEKQKKLARGIYICNNEACIRLAEKKNAFSRHLKCQIDKEIYERAREKWIKSMDSSVLQKEQEE